jgi:hypothetical protein
MTTACRWGVQSGKGYVPKHFWAGSNLCLHELKTKQVVNYQAAEEVLHVHGILLAEK